jgi:hypothetical protein
MVVPIDIVRVVWTLGAMLPVVAVGGIVSLSRVVDPPEEFIRRPRTFEESRKIETARELCGEGAHILITYANDIADLADSILAWGNLDRVADELKRIAELIEKGFKTLSDIAERVGDTQVKEAVKSTFPPKLGSDLARYLSDMARYIVEARPDPIVVYDSLEVLSRVWVNIALDNYCECLKKAGVACTS